MFSIVCIAREEEMLGKRIKPEEIEIPSKILEIIKKNVRIEKPSKEDWAEGARIVRKEQVRRRGVIHSGRR